jgi:hypothetical protein
MATVHRPARCKPSSEPATGGAGEAWRARSDSGGGVATETSRTETGAGGKELKKWPFSARKTITIFPRKNTPALIRDGCSFETGAVTTRAFLQNVTSCVPLML